MKKMILLTAALLLYGAFIARAQSAFLLDEKLRHLYAPLDKRVMVTGHLVNQQFSLVEPALFKGRTSDTIRADINTFGMLYGAMSKSAVNGYEGLRLPVRPGYLDTLDQKGGSHIAITLLTWQYERILPDIAMEHHLLGYEAGQFFDVPERLHSPFFPDTLWVAAPAVRAATTLSPVFTLPKALWHTNISGAEPIVSLDAGDGKGWQSIGQGHQVKAQYSNAGDKTLILRLSYPNQTVYARMRLKVTPPALEERGWGTTPDISVPLVASQPYLGEAATGTLHVFYNCDRKKLLKPLLLVEGIEISFPSVSFDVSADYDDFFEKLKYKGDLNARLRDLIEPEGYDIIYLDYSATGGADYIQRNAFLVEEAIKWINEQKLAAGSSEQNVVMGVSMGGLVAKYALTRMEHNQANHDTRLFISYDSPLKGANIPIGTQCFLAFMHTYSLGLIPAVEDVYSAVQSPATRQMLLYHVNAIDGVSEPVNQDKVAFYAEMDALGPLSVRHVAISNGADDGTMLENSTFAGTTFFGFVGRYSPCITVNLPEWLDPFNVIPGLPLCETLATMVVDIKATGNNVITPVFSVNLHIPIPVVEDIDETILVSCYTKPYDTAPGGFSILGTAPLGFALAALPTPPGVAIVGGLTATAPAINHHCFIPTFSALNAPEPAGLGGTSVACGVASRCSTPDASMPAICPYNGLPEKNQDHVFIDTRIAALLVDELITLPNVGDDLPQVPGVLNTYFNAALPSQSSIPDLIISGPSGKLSINNTGLSGYATGSQPFGISNQFSAHTGCGDIVVEAGSRMVIGADNGEKHGRLLVSSGATLHIKSGGVLQITSEKSSLIVKPEGRLILDAGAIVELSHSESHIRIEGALVVNGDITFSGNGYFHFTGKPQQLVFGEGCQQFVLTGNNPSQRFVHISSPIWVEDGHQLHWRNGLLEIEKGGIGLYKASGVNFSDMTIIGNDEETAAIGMSGAGDQNLTRCQITGFEKVIYGENSGTVHIKQCQFDQIGVAIEVNNNPGWLDIEGSTFSNYGRTAVEWIESSPVQISYCTFEGNKGNSALFLTNIPFVIANGTYFNNHKGEFTSVKQAAGLTPAVYIDNGLAVFKNSHFQNNTLGIKSLTLPGEGAVAAAVLLVNGSSFYGNDIGIYMEGNETKGLVLADCASFFNNANGIAGTDITLMLDSYYTSIWSGDTDTPNMFVRDNQLQGGTTDSHIAVCYNEKSPLSSRMMRNNWWGIWDVINNNGTIFDPQPEGLISLYKSDCSSIATEEIINPRPLIQPDGCLLEGKPDVFGSDNTLSDCTVGVDLSDGPQVSVNQKWHEGFYLLKTDHIEQGVEVLKPVADLWQSDMSSYDDNCRSYIAVAKAIVDGNAQNRSKLGNISSDLSLLVVPNPAQGRFSVKLPDEAQHIFVYNFQGKKMYESPSAKGSLEVFANNWPTGTYFVHAIDTSGSVRLAKVIIE